MKTKPDSITVAAALAAPLDVRRFTLDEVADFFNVPRPLVEPMARPVFVMVSHTWHVRSQGWQWQLIEAETLEGAKRDAAWIHQQQKDHFYRSGYLVIELETPGLRKPRRLTWWERITGRVRA